MSNSHILNAVNVNYAFMDGLWWMRAVGMQQGSRNGNVIRAPGPVVTEYALPRQRILFNPVRDANAVFHLMETIWMFAGQRNVDWLLDFNSKFINFAEPDTHEQWGAYGHRWVHHFGNDQVGRAINELRRSPQSRRVVIGMWDPRSDLCTDVRDVPCNTHLYFEIVEGKLNMTICCRSNDMLWGAYGANAVHFSMLMEAVAHSVGVEMGTMYQFSNNFHLYTDIEQVKYLLQNPPSHAYDHYALGICDAVPLLRNGESWWDLRDDCRNFVKMEFQESGPPGDGFKTEFLNAVAYPLWYCYLARKNDMEYSRTLEEIPHCDWKVAFSEWVQRREA